MIRSVKIKQRDITDCGAACLASVAAYYGLELPVARIRQFASTDKKGTNVLGMVEAAKKLGFDAKGVKGPFESLSKIPKPAIAHIVVNNALHHFVVIYNVTTSYVEIMDPGDGKSHRYAHEDFKKVWTSVLVILMPADTFEKGKETKSVSSRIIDLIRPYKSVLIKSVAGALVYTIIGLSTSIYVQQIIDSVLANSNRNLLHLMSVMMIGLLFIAISIGYMKSLFTLQIGQLIDTRLILGYYQHLLRLPLQFFDSMRVGEILSRINDAVKIRTFINEVFINLAVNFFVVASSFALMFTYYWKLAAIILLVIPLYSIIYIITNYLNKKIERKLMENSAELESQLVESLTSISTIKSFGLEYHAQFKTEDKFYKLLSTLYKSGVSGLRSNFSTELTSRLFTILLLSVGAGFVLDNKITTGELLSFYTLIGYFTGPASSLISMNKFIQNAWIAADRLFEITDLEQEEYENKILLTRDMIGDIKLRNINFRYGTHNTVFHDLTLDIQKGSMVAIVGESGSGKSTLIQLLLHLYPITGGSIHIGEYDVKYIQNSSLRTLIAPVPQNIHLFSGNIIDNIAVGDEAPDVKKIISICTQLGMMNFIEKLPAGFNSYIGENGATISGGQKQRIAIARALYRDPEILILDEATSSLDSTSEKYVQNTLDHFREQHKTIIIIAHRLSTIYNADKIVVLENGRVAEEGRHEDLIKTHGAYHRLWENQYAMPGETNEKLALTH